MTTLKVTVKQNSNKGESTLEGSYQLPGSSLTKLAKKDGSTKFSNRATLNQTARKVASVLGWELQYEEPAKKAAKKSVKSKTSSAKAAAPKSKKVKVKAAKTAAVPATACTPATNAQ